VPCNTILIDEFSSTSPVSPLIVRRNKNPVAHKQVALYVIWDPYVVASQQQQCDVA
jgi:hypothetical protein